MAWLRSGRGGFNNPSWSPPAGMSKILTGIKELIPIHQ